MSNKTKNLFKFASKGYDEYCSPKFMKFIKKFSKQNKLTPGEVVERACNDFKLKLVYTEFMNVIDDIRHSIGLADDGDKRFTGYELEELQDEDTAAFIDDLEENFDKDLEAQGINITKLMNYK